MGSFFNVVALRIPRGLSIVHPPSSCPDCGTRLRARDLFPVFSYLLTKGKCRACDARVSGLYPIGEASTGLLFAWVYWRFNDSIPELIVGILLISLCVIVTITDLRYMLIPNKILLFFAPLLLVSVLYQTQQPIWSHLLGALLGGGVLMLVVWLSRGGMGMGDVKLLTLFGFVVGLPQVILVLLIASFAGALIGAVLLLTKMIKRKQPVPFGPYLALGVLISYGYGNDIIQQYLSIFY